MFNLHFNFRDDAVRSSKQASALLLSAFSLLFIVPFASASQVHQDHGSSHSHYEYLSGQNHGQQIAQQNRLQAKAETQELLDSLNAYRSADKADKKSALNQMVSLAKQRKDYLKQLMESDPAAVAGAVLTAAERQQMPEAVSQYLEQKKTLDGELEVFYEDYEDHSKSRLRHILKTANGRVELHMAENAAVKALQSGVKVRVRGWNFSSSDESSDPLVLDNEQNNLILLADGAVSTTSTSNTSTSVLKNTLGEQRTLVMLVNFQDNAQEPWTVNEVRDMVFGTVNDYYKENSNNQTWLSGDVIGYDTLPISAVCDTAEISSAAQDLADINGLDLSNYDRLIYIFPKIDNCGWTGKGTVGGTPSKAWINGELNLRTVGHELGHNLGLHHAKKLECGVDVVDGDCYTIEYGDSLEIMGTPGFTGHFNAFNKDSLGWFDNGSSSAAGKIVEVDTDGSYLLEPYESAPEGNAKAIKIQRGVDASTGQKLWYYLEYRQPLGFDSYLSSYPNITAGVTFHLGTEADLNSSQIIDLTPSSIIADWNDAVLSAGASYTDADAGITITTEWADSTGASIHVSFSEATCTHGSPALSVVANDSAAAAAGSSVSYNITVSNNDSNGCSSTGYDVSATVPAGWSSTASTLELAPGTSETVTLNVTSADTAIEGSYNITFNAVNSADSSDYSSVVASYLVEAPAEVCVLSNPVLTVSANQGGEVAAGSMVSYTATVTNQDSVNCDAATVDVVANVPDGWSADRGTVTLEPGQSGFVNLNVMSAETAAQAAYPIEVYAFNTADIAYNSSSEVIYSVAAPEAVCVQSAPLLSVAFTGGEVVSGSTVAYDVTVTNKNSSDCAATNYTLVADVPPGWSSTSSSLSLASGQSSTLQLQVTSSSSASEGTYNIAVHAQDSADSSIISNAMVNYVIVNPINSTPVAVDDNVELVSKDPTMIDVLANDSDPDGDALIISFVTQGAKGSVEMTESGQLLYTPAKNFKGNDNFSYTISDGDKTATATVSVSMVSISGPSSNNGKGNK